MSIFTFLLVIFVYLWVSHLAVKRHWQGSVIILAFFLVNLLAGLLAAIPAWFFWLCMILIVVVGALIFIPKLCESLLWKPLYKYLKRHILPMSATEKIAAEAGGVWWERDLFSGTPEWNKLFNLPTAELTPREQKFIDNELAGLLRMIDIRAIEEQKQIPEEVWLYLKKHRFFALVIPEEFGGWGFSHLAHAEVVGRLAIYSSALAVTVMVPNSLGPGELIYKYGSDKQRKRYLPRLSSAKDIPCFALTSPHAGSDATSIVDTGVVCMGEWRKKKTLGLRLNWNKRYITLAPVATLIGLAVKVQDPDKLLPNDHHLNGKVDLGITCVLVSANTPGVRIGRRHNPMNVYFHNGPISGVDVFVPLDDIIGGAEMIGEGWRMLVECLTVGRCLSLPTLSVSGAQIALASSAAYAGCRVQFGQPIARFEAIGLQNAQLALNALSSTAMARLAIDILDDHKNSAVMSSMLKLHNTELLRDSVNRAMDIHGGRAVMLGWRNYLGELYNSIPVAITVEGANTLLANLVIFGQGVLRCHPYLRDETERVANSDALNEQIVDTFSNHARHIGVNVLRVLSSAWTANLFHAPTRDSAPAKPQRQIGTLSAQMATLVELCLLLYGSTLKRREAISSKFALAWTELFSACSVLREYSRSDGDRSFEFVCDLTIQRALHRCQVYLLEICRNLNIHSSLALLVRVLIIPPWSRINSPSDEKLLELSRTLSRSDGLRRRLCARVVEVVDDKSENHPMSVVEKALAARSELSELRGSLPAHLAKTALGAHLHTLADDPVAREALGVNGTKRWRELANLTLEAIMVDDFDARLK